MLKKIKTILSSKIVNNFFLLTVDRAFQLASQLFIIFFISKKIGPEQYGLISVSLSIISVLVAISNWGFERLLVTKFVSITESNKSSILFISFILKFSLSILLLLLTNAIDFFTDNNIVFYYVYLLFPIVFFNSWVVFDTYNQASGRVILSIKSRIISVIISFVLRLLFVLGDYEIVYYGLILCLEQLIVFLLMLYYYIREYKTFPFKFRYFRLDVTKNLFYTGFFFVISNLSILVYMKVSQLIVAKFLTLEFLGVFSLIQNIIEIPFSLVSIMSIIFLPMVTKHHIENRENYQQVTQVILSAILLVSLIAFITMFGFGFVLNIYFDSFGKFPTYYFLSLITIPFGFISYFIMLTLLAEDKAKLYFRLSLLTSFCSILVSTFCIMNFKEVGSVVSLILSQAIPGIILPLIFIKNFAKNLFTGLKNIFNLNMYHKLVTNG